MAVVLPYKAGTVTATSGSAVVTATGTAWAVQVVNGGEFSFKGRSIPILSIDSATQLTLVYPAPADMAGSGTDYAISLGRAGAADAVTANARLAQLVAQLQGFSPFFQSLTDDVDGPTFRQSIGAAAPLAFSPVQEGGGIGQLVNKIMIGWSGAGLKGQVDATDLGFFLFTGANGVVQAAKLALRPDIEQGIGSSVVAFPSSPLTYSQYISGNQILTKQLNGSFISLGLTGTYQCKGNVYPIENGGAGSCLLVKVS